MNHRFFVFVSLLLAGLASCTHSIAVDELGGLAEYQETGRVLIDDGDQQVEITDENNPHLVLRTASTCLFPFQSLIGNCGGTVDVPLEMVTIGGEEVSVSLTSGERSGESTAITLPSKEFRGAALRVENHVPHDWQPTYGVGLTLAGPSMLYCPSWSDLRRLSRH